MYARILGRHNNLPPDEWEAMFDREVRTSSDCCFPCPILPERSDASKPGYFSKIARTLTSSPAFRVPTNRRP